MFANSPWKKQFFVDFLETPHRDIKKICFFLTKEGSDKYFQKTITCLIDFFLDSAWKSPFFRTSKKVQCLDLGYIKKKEYIFAFDLREQAIGCRGSIATRSSFVRLFRFPFSFCIIAFLFFCCCCFILFVRSFMFQTIRYINGFVRSYSIRAAAAKLKRKIAVYNFPCLLGDDVRAVISVEPLLSVNIFL